jgi:PiT family inorganic phosphate transporter
MLVFTSLLALYLAWNLGANDVANSMGTSVGSKALTLKQALLLAAILEFSGAVLFGHGVAETLAKKVINPSLFTDIPQTLLLGMLTVLIACGIWMNVATVLGLPVSSSHAVVGAIAGFACVAISPAAVNWQAIGVISLTWVGTPVASGAISALFYRSIHHWILAAPDPIAQLQEWIPWLSAVLFSVFGIIVLPALQQTPLFTELPLPFHTLALTVGGFAAVGLTLASWQRLRSIGQIEPLLAQFQIASACFVAFAHGSNDVGNAIAPVAVIAYINATGSIPPASFQVPLWVLTLGAVGIVAGLAVWGKKVIATVGEGIIPLQPSGGFCAEIATATTVLLASRLGLPVSTSHALVGGVVGVGMAQNLSSIQLGTLRSILLAWVVTVPLAATLAAGFFWAGKEIKQFL